MLEARQMLAADTVLGTESHRWNFDTTGDDQLGNLNADLLGGAVVENAGIYIGQGALRLDGISAYGNLDNNHLEDGFSRYSVTAWFRADDTNGVQVIYEEGGATNGLALRLNGNTLQAAVRSDGAASQETVSIAGVSPNTWHFAAVTFDNGQLSLYLNGSDSPATATAGYSSIPEHTDDANIGRQSVDSAFGEGTSGYFAGLIDEVRVFDGLAITPADVDLLADRQEIQVNSISDTFTPTDSPSSISLRQALTLAQELPGENTITFAPSLFGHIPQTITLSHDGSDNGNLPDTLSITSQVTIEGPGSDLLAISGDGLSRILSVESTATVSVSGVSLVDGYAIDSGGAIANYGDLTLVDVNVSNSGNSTGPSRATRRGGALFNESAILTIRDSYFEGNISEYGGAIYVLNNSVVDIRTSTFANNRARYEGQVVAGGALRVYSTSGTANVIVDHSTFSNNQSDGYGGGIAVINSSVAITNSTLTENRASGSGGGIVSNGNTTLNNSIIAGNTASNADAWGGVSGSYNLLGPGSQFSGSNNIFLTTNAPLVSPLGDYGGITPTHALLPGSLAIDAGMGTTLTTDQRGFDRSVDDLNTSDGGDGFTDIGAFEYSENLIVNTTEDELDAVITSEDLSLREALELAERFDGPNTIRFDQSIFGTTPQTITLSYDDAASHLTAESLEISSEVTIEGPGANLLTVSGDYKTRVFNIDSDADANIEGLTIANGLASDGGGLFVAGSLILADSVVRDNQAVGNGGSSEGYGGGIAIAGGTLTLENSAIVDNEASYYGGGVATDFASSDQSLVIRSSLIARNTALFVGGVAIMSAPGSAIHNSMIVSNNANGGSFGGVYVYSSQDSVDLVNLTVTRNKATNNPGAGITSFEFVDLHNSIVVGNGDPAAAPFGNHNYYGSISDSSSHNLIGSTQASVSGPFEPEFFNFYEVESVDVFLTASSGLPSLFNNGDFARTPSLLSNSPAINAGDDSIADNLGLFSDQRGNPRKLGTAVDIGAIEAGPTITIAGTDFLTPASPNGTWTFTGAGSLMGSNALVRVDWGDDSPTELVNLGQSLSHSYALSSPSGLENYRITAEIESPTSDSNGIPVLAERNVSVTLGAHSFIETGGTEGGKATAEVEFIGPGEPSQFIVREGDSFSASLRKSIEIRPTDNPNQTQLVIGFSDLQLPTNNDGTINDAFEIALLGDDGQSLVPTIGSGRDAFFNLTETETGLVETRADGVSFVKAEGRVVLNVQNVGQIGQTTSATLVYRLVNNDGDQDSRVTVPAGDSFLSFWSVNETSIKNSSLDPEDSAAGRLFRYSGDYNSGDGGFENDFGRVFMPDGVTPVGNEIEAMAVDANGTAYFVVNQKTFDPGGLNLTGPLLLTVDLAEVVARRAQGIEPAAVVQRYVTLPLQSTVSQGMFSSSDNQDIITGITVDPITGDLLGLYKTDDNGGTDQLLRFHVEDNPSNSQGLIFTGTSGNEIVSLGALTTTNGGPDITNGEALTLDFDGSLIISDTFGSENARLHRVTFDSTNILSQEIIPGLGDVLSALASDPNVPTDVKIEGIGIDPRNGDIIGTNSSGVYSQLIVFEPSANGTNWTARIARDINEDFDPDNDDSDQDSDIEALAFVTVAQSPPGNFPTDARGTVIGGELLGNTTDITTEFSVSYGTTTYNRDTGTLFARLAVELDANIANSGRVVLVASGISDPTVDLTNADGITLDGDAFYDLTPLLQTSGVNYLQGTLDNFNLQFANPEGVAFSYSTKILIESNLAPKFDNEPIYNGTGLRTVELLAGEEFSFDFLASDPEGDAPLEFTIVQAPAGFEFANPLTGSDDGIVSWTPDASLAGHTFPVVMRVEDPFGNADELSFFVRPVSVDVTIDDLSVSEADGVAEVKVYLSSPIGADITLEYRTVEGSAVDEPPLTGSDYLGTTSNTIQIFEGDTTASIWIPISGDSTVEAIESFAVELVRVVDAAGRAVRIVDADATVTIFDDDSSEVSVIATDASAAEPNENGVFEISLSSPSDTATTISYAMSGVATNGVDYEFLTNSITIPAGQLTAPILIDVIDDNQTEGDEAATITLTGIVSGNTAVTLHPTAISDSVVIADNDTGITLREETRFFTEHRFPIPTAPAIEFAFSELSFDSLGDNPSDVNDAFEIAIIDSQGRAAEIYSVGQLTLGTIGSGSDALFNLTQGQAPVWGPGVELLDSGGTVVSTPVADGSLRINLDGLRNDRTYELVVRLVNNDADEQTQVVLSSDSITALAAPISVSATLLPSTAQDANSDATRGSVRYGQLRDVTQGFNVAYQYSTVDQLGEVGFNEYRTRLEVSKLPGLQVRNDVLLAIRPAMTQALPGDIPNPTQGATRLINFDGTLPYSIAGLPAGTPFVRLTGMLNSENGFYTDSDGNPLQNVELAFEHQGNERFDFELVVLGELNDPPRFTSDPYATQRGDAYPIDFVANPNANNPDDPANATLPMLEIVAARGNTLRYTPSTTDPNDDYVGIQILSGPIVDPDVADDTANVYSGMRAIDTDGDGFDDTLVWTPRNWDEVDNDLGIHTVTIRSIDEHGLWSSANDQTFQIRVVDDSFNRPPSFKSPPDTLATHGEGYSYDSNAVDPEGHTLAYSGQLGARPQEYEFSLAEFAGDDLTHLTFVNQDANSNAIGMYQGVRIYERDSATTSEVMRFEATRFSQYGTGISPGFAQVTGDLSVVRLEGDATLAYRLPTTYRVTPNTVLEFVYSSESEGELQGLGVDTQTATFEDGRWFRVYGTETTGGNTLSPDDYVPAWTTDQTTNFQVASDSGVVTWNDIPAEAINRWVHVDLTATETDSGDALQANQAYELFVKADPLNNPPVILTPSLPDYTLPREEVVGSEVVPGQFTVYRKRPTDEADLKNALFGTGSGITLASGEDNFIVKSHYAESNGNLTVSSIGTFADGEPLGDNPEPKTYGLEQRGIVLSTGDVRDYGSQSAVPNFTDMGHSNPDNSTNLPNQASGDFIPDLSTGNSSDDPQVYELLESITAFSEGRGGVTSIDEYTDITTVTVVFNVDDPAVTSIVFDVVFGSEEWGPAFGNYVGSSVIDAFGIFLNPFESGTFDESSNVTGLTGFVPEIGELAGADHPAVQVWTPVIAGDPEEGTISSRAEGDLIGTVENPLALPLNVDHPQIIDPQYLPPSITNNVSLGPNLDGVLWPYNIGENLPGTSDTLLRKDTPKIRFELNPIPGRNEVVFVLADSSSVDLGDSVFDTTAFISGFTTVSTAPYSEVVEAIDPDKDELTYSIERDFAFEAANPGVIFADNDTAEFTISNEPNSKGQVDWTPTVAGEYYVKVVVDDGRGGTDEEIYTMTVNEAPSGTNTPPVIDDLSFTAQQGRTFSLPTTVTQPNGETDRLTYELEGAPDNSMQIDANGIITWTPPVGQTGTLAPITVRVTDSGGESDTATLTLTVEAFDDSNNALPVITTTAFESILQGDTYRYQALATDDDFDVLTWTKSFGPDALQVTEEGLVVWDTRRVEPGDYPVTIEVFDGIEKVFQPFTIRVLETNLPPTIGDIEPQVVELTNSLLVPISVSDPNGDALVLSISPLTILPSGVFQPTLSSEIYQSGDSDITIDWTPPAVGQYFFEVTVDDGRGLPDRELLSVFVYENDLPPTFLPSTLQGDAIILGEDWELAIYATDDNDVVTDSRVVGSNIVIDIDPAAKARGITYDQSAGKLLWTPEEAADGFVIVTATDSAGQTQTLELTLPVNVRQNPGGNDPAKFDNEVGPNAPIVGRPWSFLFQASDLDDDLVTIDIVSFKDAEGNDLILSSSNSATDVGGVSLNAVWNVPIDAVGPVTMIVTANDDTPSPDGLPDAEWIVSLPVIQNLAPQLLRFPESATVEINEPFDFHFDLFDADGDQVHVELLTPAPGDGTFLLVDGPSETPITGLFPASSDPTDPTKFKLVFQPTVAGRTELKLLITDTFGNRTPHTIDLSVVDPATAAEPLDGILRYRQTASVGQLYTAQVDRQDETLTNVEYKFEITGGVLVTEIDAATDYSGFPDASKPVGLQIDPATGRIEWTASASQLTNEGDDPYKYKVVMHEVGNVANRATFGPVEVTVNEQFRNTPPRIVSDAKDIPFSLTKPFVYELEGEDDQNDPLTWVHVAGPGSLNGNVFTWTPDQDDLGLTRTVVLRVDDPYGPGESQTLEFTLTSTQPGGEQDPGGPDSLGNTPPRITSTATKPGLGGETYTYTVRGTDDDGHDFTLLPPIEVATDPDLDWIPNADGSATFVWRNSMPNETRTFEFGIVDEKGLRGASQRYEFTVGSSGGVGTPDTPIVFTGAPPQSVAVGSTYNYQLEWIDPDLASGQFPTFTLDAEYISGGSAASLTDLLANGFDPATGTFSWLTTADAEGVLLLTVTASEGGATAERTYSLQVFDSVANPNLQPRLGPNELLEATPGQPFTFQASGTDDGPFEYFLVNDAGELVTEFNGFSITPTGLVTWNVPVDEELTDEGGGVPRKSFHLDLLDDAGQRAVAPVTHEIRVTEDQPPAVTVVADPGRQEAEGQVVFRLFPQDDVGLADVRLMVTGPGLAFGGQTLRVEDNNTALFTIPDGVTPTSVYTATATVVDTIQQFGTGSASVTVRAVNEDAPDVQITSRSGFNLEEAFDVRGIVSDEDRNLTYFSVTATPSGGGTPIILREQDINDPELNPSLKNSGGFLAIGDSDNVQTLTTLSPLALADGTYLIRVTARDDAGEEETATAVYGIDSDQKLGNFSLSFTDLTVPVAGFPLNVVRNYDSLDTNSRGEDFGYGWSLELVTGKLEYTSAQGGDNDFRDFVFGSVVGDTQPMIGGSIINITLPDGEEHSFTLTPIAVDQGATFGVDAIQGSFGIFTAAFRPDGGQASELEFVRRSPTGNTPLALEQFFYPAEYDQFIAEQQFLDGFTSFRGRYLDTGEFVAYSGDGTPINPTNLDADFKLTTRDGTQYIFDSASGELLKIIDPDENTLEFRDNRYTARAADGTPMGELKIIRGSGEQGRITRVEDERGVGIDYGYDSEGKLTSVTDRIGAETKYFYGEDDYSDLEVNVDPKVLTSIKGVTAQNGENDRTLTIGWDIDGRIRRLGDAGGGSATFDYDTSIPGLSGYSSEAISDAIDGATETVRDPSGNVVGSFQRLSNNGTPEDNTDDLWQVVVFAYDSEDRQIGDSKPYIVDESIPTESRYETVIELRDGLLTADLNDATFGSNADIWASVQGFDTQGRLTEEIDAAGGRTTYENFNDEFGFASRVVDPSGAVTITSNTIVFNDRRNQTSTVLNSKGPNSVTRLNMLGPNIQGVTQGGDASELTTITSIGYDNQLRIASTTSGGVTTSYAYDGNDNQYLTINFWSDPNNILPDHAIVNEIVYDADNRPIGNKRYSLEGAQSVSDVLSQIATATPLWETSTAYNLAGQLYRSEDRYDTATYTLYDVRGNAIESRSATNDPNTGRDASTWIVTRTRYDLNGRVVAVSAPEVVLNPLAPDQTGFNPVSDQVIDPSDGTVLLSSEADARSRVTHTLYDPLGRVVETRQVEGVPIVTAQIFAATSPENSLFSTAFDASYDQALHVISRITSDYDGEGRVFRSVAYAEFDRLATEMRSYYRYDAGGRQTGAAIAYDDNDNGVINVNEFVDGSLDFDAPGNEVFISTTVYDVAGREESATDARDVTREFEYDDLGRLLGTTIDPTGLNITMREAYDHTGRRVTSTNALGQVTRYRFDEATGRLLGVTLPAITDDSRGSITGAPEYDYGYDKYGNQTSITDPNDHTTDFVFDELGRQTSRTLPEGLVDMREYNDLGQVVRSVDLGGRTTDYLYDDFGRLEEKRFFDVGKTPDADAGQATNHDELVDYIYDALGRITQIGQDRDLMDPGFERTTTHSYDDQGRLQRVATDEGVIRYEYDELGRLVTTLSGEVAASAPTVTRYEYDPLGRTASVISERLGGFGVALADQTTEYRYDAVGNLQYVLGPEHSSFYEYDNANRLTDLIQFVDSSTLGTVGEYDEGIDRRLATFEYTVRQDGRRTAATETFYGTNGSTELLRNDFTWDYDQAGRLTQETLTSSGSQALTGYTDTYGFDLTGNRTRYQHNSTLDAEDKTVTYLYDRNDRLLVERSFSDLTGTTLDTTTLYEYGTGADPLAEIGGNSDRQTRKTVYDGDPINDVVNSDAIYGYNVQGRLDTVNNGSSATTTTYEYSDDGIRVAQQVGTAEKQLFLIDNQNPTGYAQVIEERALSMAVERAYLLGHDVLAQQDAESDLVRLLYDGHGSTRGLVNATGPVDATGQLLDAAVYTYDAYGVRLDANTERTTLLYSGEWRDANGFDYLRARPYDFKTGRFMRVDDYAGSIRDPQSLHKYLYTHGDPISGTDPSGLVNLIEVNFVSQQQNTKVAQSANNGIRAGGVAARTLVAIALLEMQRQAASIDTLKDFQLPIALYNSHLAARFAKGYKGKRGDAALSSRLHKIGSYMASLGVSADRIRGLDPSVKIKSLNFLSGSQKGTTLLTTWIPLTGRYRFDRVLSFASALGFSSANVLGAINGSGNWAQAAANAAQPFIDTLRNKGVSATGFHKRWVWHHNEIVGIMELTDREEHERFGHTGGAFFYEVLTQSKYK